MDRPRAAVITVGTELTTGFMADTNGREIARMLRAAGYHVDALMSVPDDEDAIAEVISWHSARHALVVVTGGLGPTHDDRTREAASRALGAPLVRDQSIASRIAELPTSPSTDAIAWSRLRQADVLAGARVLPAVTGIAPGQVFTRTGSTVVLLPGPPDEMRPILDAYLGSTSSTVEPRVLRCAGISESEVGARVGELLSDVPGVGYTLLAGPMGVDIVLFDDGAGGPALDTLIGAARAELGPHCFGSDRRSLAENVIDLLRARGMTLACAESCTGGGVAAALTDVPGASHVFVGGVVAYSNAVKTDMLNVAPDVLARHGAVSEAVALAMAEGALRRLDADIAVSTTGIAGPGGGSPDKPVGLVWLAVARTGGSSFAVRRLFGGDRALVRARATAHALDQLRRTLEEA